MDTDLKTDLRMSLCLAIAVLGFPLWVQDTPPPTVLHAVAVWQIEPLDAALADRFYDQATLAWILGDRELNKAWLVPAIQFDPIPFSPRYQQYQQERSQKIIP